MAYRYRVTVEIESVAPIEYGDPIIDSRENQLRIVRMVSQSLATDNRLKRVTPVKAVRVRGTGGSK